MKKLIGIFDIKTNTPEEIYQKVKEALENKKPQKQNKSNGNDKA